MSIQKLVKIAITEDLGEELCDITTDSLIQGSEINIKKAKLIAREDFYFFGHEAAREVCKQISSELVYEPVSADGKHVVDNEILAYIKGPWQAILKAERTVLNFLQRLSGVCSNAREYVVKLSSDSIKILDTRKTTPGWRILEKDAAKAGGVKNHRIGLYDAVLIKNNHLDFSGLSPKDAILKCKERAKGASFIEIEVRDKSELLSALEGEPDIILLDNMSPAQIRSCIELVQSSKYQPPKLEVSGGITLENIASYNIDGISYISVGAITHSAKSKDISLRYVD